MKGKVLFLCTGNSARSQMAEGLLREKAGERFEVFSAGTEPHPVNPAAIKAMDEIGIDISGQKSNDLTDYLGQEHIGTLIIVCDKANETCPRVWPGVQNRYYWPFDDPAVVEGSDEEKLAVFRRVRDEIAAKLDEWLAE